MSRVIFCILLFIGVLNADYISNFNSDKTTVTPDDIVNLSLTYIATKKYELHFTAYNNNTGVELSPSFVASSLNDVQYTIPSDADYEIKIVANLVEDGSVVDSKEVILNASNGVSSQYDCPVWAYFYDGKCWAWASPCDGGCSTITFSRVSSGWRYINSYTEYNERPSKTLMPCAAKQFDNKWLHCDYCNDPAYPLTYGCKETWVVCEDNCLKNDYTDNDSSNINNFHCK